MGMAAYEGVVRKNWQKEKGVQDAVCPTCCNPEGKNGTRGPRERVGQE